MSELVLMEEPEFAQDGSVSQHTKLDPADWEAFRSLAHRMVDDMTDYLSGAYDRPTWRPMPSDLSERLQSEPVPYESQGEEAVYEQYVREVLPYPMGNIHPRFFGWVQGTGIPYANMADMLASALNSHMAGFPHGPACVEEQVINWFIEIMGFPPTASGLLESGGTMANVLGVAVGRHAKAGFDVRTEGVGSSRLTIYCSAETHGWVRKGAELMGLGSSAVRSVGVDTDFRINIEELKTQIIADKEAGYRPICVVGTAGTVNTGATDDLNALADLCQELDLWFHIDGAFGALLKLSNKHASMVDGLERADSVAFDLHKWMYLPFEIACLLVRDEATHKAAFSYAPSYIANLGRGVIAGGLTFADRGIDLTRNFKALKAWMCMKAFGIRAFGEAIDRNMAQNRLLVSLIEAHLLLEMVAPAPMNTACFRLVREGTSDEILNKVNLEVLLRLQESGIAVPSSTVINDKFAIRVCNVNHRTRDEDMQIMVDEIVRLGETVLGEPI